MASTRTRAMFVMLSAAVLISILQTLGFGFHWQNDGIPKPLPKPRLIEQMSYPGKTEVPKHATFSDNTRIKPRPLEYATSSKNTKVVVLNRDRLYHQGDVLTVSVEARDAEGRPKTYGGDFFRARLSSGPAMQKSSTGRVTDHGNGTYTVQFPLFWVGNASILIQLVHPSEAVRVLQRVREVPNNKIYDCTFLDERTNITETRQCFSSADPSLPPHQQCDLSRREVNATWFCRRPDRLPCASISKCRIDKAKSEVNTENRVSHEERKLFQKPYVEEELKDLLTPIRVLESEVPTSQHLPACPGNTSEPLTHGHWSGNAWKSSVCNVRVFAKADVQRCLANKTVFMQGDSTLRQWYQRLKEVVPLYDNRTPLFPRMGSAGLLGGDNSGLKTAVRYRFHSHPIQGRSWNTFYAFPYTPDELDAIVGGPNTVIVVGLWAHFTSDPIEIFRARLHAIRHAIHRLLYRSPGTRVFVRTGTTREHKNQELHFYLLASDWLAYQITEEIRQIFRADRDVVVLDTWDMSVCQGDKDNIHPKQPVVDSQLNILFSHICPK